MAKRNAASGDSKWQNNMITLVLDESDFERLRKLQSGHFDTNFLDTVASKIGDGHSLKFKYSEYYGCWVISVTFGEYIKHLNGKTIITYIKNLDRVPAFIHYLFDDLIENDDSRLRQGGMAIGDW